jgi:carbamoyl-phosphate synthase small subunit
MEGEAIGAEGTVTAELVFNTSMSGYQEILTDPSYKNQIVTLTYPEIGNVGVNLEDNESNKAWCSGLVIRKLSHLASNWRHTQSLPDFLKAQNIVAISNIDTRHVTHILRETGVQSVCLTTELDDTAALQRAKAFAGLDGADLAQEVTTPESYVWSEGSECHIVAYDFGVKSNILKLLAKPGVKVTVVNAKTPVEAVLAMAPDGVFLSNGPGDPSACTYAIEATRVLLEKNIPMFGICLGFQILALALGATTQKMKFGHHGANHPVINLQSQKIFITSQNHGFMVSESTLPKQVTITHRSLFDDSIQGIIYNNSFGFQGHPEASPGPHDIDGLFDDFINNMRQ